TRWHQQTGAPAISISIFNINSPQNLTLSSQYLNEQNRIQISHRQFNFGSLVKTFVVAYILQQEEQHALATNWSIDQFSFNFTRLLHSKIPYYFGDVS
ncbi:MAG: hypothetical protein OXE99_14525, partial [Cellvibrionales bacterium]|nr:hypothetical protein [Cellvibrionales bacterium]